MFTLMHNQHIIDEMTERLKEFVETGKILYER